MDVPAILNQLDSCARAFTFPMLDNGYIYLAAARLSSFRDSTRWAIAIEVLGANHRAGGHSAIQNCIHLFGNCLRRSPGTANEDFLYPTADSDGAPVFSDDYSVELNPDATSIRIRNKVVPVRMTREALEGLGIPLAEPPNATAADLVRALALSYRHLLLATPAELAQRVPPDLPTFLVLDEWFHPDLAGDELPSQSDTFCMIAEALETGDLARYRPTHAPNTHWSNWPDAGSL